MVSAIARSGIILGLATLLHACGGGGGGGGGGVPGVGNPPPSGSGTRVSFSTTSVTVAATPGNAAPVSNITLTVTNPPASGLYVEGNYSANGIDNVGFVASSPTQATLTIYFRTPGSLQNSTYTDTIQLRVCTDDPCNTQIAGSPANINTTYTVSGNGTSAASLDRNSIDIAADSDDQSVRVETVRVALSAPASTPVYIQASHTTNAVQSTSYRNITDLSSEVDIAFRPGQTLGPGTYNDTVTLEICYDQTCVRQLQGSPLTISTSMLVGAGAEPGVAPLDVVSRVALPHDVVDAEFSKPLNRLVMVGSYPSNALYVYDVATATEQQVALNRTPTSVSISPDGMTAAVGHDALITVVDLTTVGQPGAPSPTVLNVSAVVFDVVLDGNGYVHALPRTDQWVNIHSVHIASNTEYLSTGVSLRAGSHGRLHPSGSYLYAADNGLSPDDIEKWDIRQGRAAYLYDSPYHGDYQMCGNLWFNEPGSTIYTTCGNTFRASEVQANDMVYSGRIELSVLNGVPYQIISVSQSEALDEIALLEYDYYRCEIASWTGPCYHHLAYYESEFLNRQAVYSLAPVLVNGATYAQRGLFVFHDASGTSKYLISKLDAMPNPDAEYYLSVVQ
jgi:hypothetical protein